MILWKCCTQYASKFGKLNSGHRNGKCQFSSQSQRRAMPKNNQITAQLHSFHLLARSCSKSSKLGFNSMSTDCFQMYKLDLEKAEEPEIKLPISIGSLKKNNNNKAKEFSKNIYFCFIDDTKAFDCVDHNKLWKILKEMGIADHVTCWFLRNPYADQDATVKTGHGIVDWFKIGKKSMSRLYIVTLLI